MATTDEIGQRCGMLQVIERLRGSRFRCRCDCGNERIVYTGHFNAQQFHSCGCHVDRHGHSTNGKSRTYVTYHNMIARCHKPQNKRYCDYGAKGIVVCDRWRRSFINFLEDMGECPPGMTIDRIDNTGIYEPKNCRWASREENQRNRKNSRVWLVNGIEFSSLKDAAEHLGVSTATVRAWCGGRWAEGRWYPPKVGFSWRWKYGEGHDSD